MASAYMLETANTVVAKLVIATEVDFATIVYVQITKFAVVVVVENIQCDYYQLAF